MLGEDPIFVYHQQMLAEVDERNGTLVITSGRMLIILSDYRKLFTSPTYQLELEAYISLTNPFGLPDQSKPFHLRSDQDSWYQTGILLHKDGSHKWALGVENGFACAAHKSSSDAL